MSDENIDNDKLQELAKIYHKTCFEYVNNYLKSIGSPINFIIKEDEEYSKEYWNFVRKWQIAKESQKNKNEE